MPLEFKKCFVLFQTKRTNSYNICSYQQQDLSTSIAKQLSFSNNECDGTFTVLLFPRRLYLPEVECSDRSLAIDDGTGLSFVLKTKAAKVILNRPLHSSSTEALATLKWLPLEKRRFQRRCVHVYKCINGLINHDMDLIRQDVLHSQKGRHTRCD